MIGYAYVMGLLLSYWLIFWFCRFISECKVCRIQELAAMLWVFRVAFGFTLPCLILVRLVDIPYTPPGADVMVGVRYFPALIAGCLGTLVASIPTRRMLVVVYWIIGIPILLECLADILQRFQTYTQTHH